MLGLHNHIVILFPIWMWEEKVRGSMWEILTMGRRFEEHTQMSHPIIKIMFWKIRNECHDKFFPSTMWVSWSNNSRTCCFSNLAPNSVTSRCRVVTRVRGEWGGITGFLDREITEMEEDREATDAQTRKYTETAAKRHNRNEMYASMCIYICVYSD